MGEAIGTALPLALGIAISPLPVIAAILMLLSPRARSTGVGFMIGWVAGIAIAVTLFALLANLIPERDADAHQPIKGTIQLALGALLLLVAVRQWRSSSRSDGAPRVPKWMRAIDKTTFVVAVGLGFLLSALNPKNLLLSVSAGVDVGTAELTTGEEVAAIVVIVVIAASTVVVPVVAYLVAADRLRGPLDSLRAWLQKENALIMALLMLVMGVLMIGKGIAAF